MLLLVLFCLVGGSLFWSDLKEISFFQTTSSMFSLNFLMSMVFSLSKLITNVSGILSYIAVVRYEKAI